MCPGGITPQNCTIVSYITVIILNSSQIVCAIGKLFYSLIVLSLLVETIVMSVGYAYPVEKFT